MRAIRHRLAGQAGFTLVELIIVVTIMVILLSVAVSSYLGAREKAQVAAAEGNVRVIVPSIEAYFNDHGTYSTMTLDILRDDYDSGIDPARYSFGAPANLTDSDYCVQSTAGATTYRKAGPDADVVAGTCP
jgi:prepilin-type N-terminal cleavage/methylation domain-containing protein